MAKVLESWKGIKDNDYNDFLDRALDWFGYFSLVWRDTSTFDDSADQIRRDLWKHEVEHRRASHWPGTEICRTANTPKANIITFHLDLASREILQKPGSLFGWLAPKYPEDLAFYQKDGRLAFATTSHDGIAWAIDPDFGWGLPKHLDFNESKSDEEEWKNYTAYGDGAVKL